MISAAKNKVSATISATGRKPISTSVFNDVFMPSAAIALTRHQREISISIDWTGTGSPFHWSC